MQFDWSVHLGDLILAASIGLGGVAYLVQDGKWKQKVDSSIERIFDKFEDHEKLLDESRSDRIRIHDRIDGLPERRQHARG